MNTVQSCVICAWRGNCAKRFSVSDGGARCPDFSRDVTIKEVPDDPSGAIPSKGQPE